MDWLVKSAMEDAVRDFAGSGDSENVFNAAGFSVSLRTRMGSKTALPRNPLRAAGLWGSAIGYGASNRTVGG